MHARDAAPRPACRSASQAARRPARYASVARGHAALWVRRAPPDDANEHSDDCKEHEQEQTHADARDTRAAVQNNNRARRRGHGSPVRTPSEIFRSAPPCVMALASGVKFGVVRAARRFALSGVRRASSASAPVFSFEDPLGARSLLTEDEIAVMVRRNCGRAAPTRCRATARRVRRVRRRMRVMAARVAHDRQYAVRKDFCRASALVCLCAAVSGCVRGMTRYCSGCSRIVAVVVVVVRAHTHRLRGVFRTRPVRTAKKSCLPAFFKHGAMRRLTLPS